MEKMNTTTAFDHTLNNFENAVNQCTNYGGSSEFEWAMKDLMYAIRDDMFRFILKGGDVNDLNDPAVAMHVGTMMIAALTEEIKHHSCKEIRDEYTLKYINKLLADNYPYSCR